MIPHLAIAAFCGLRSAEIARLDWSEVHLTGAEHFIEVKAAKAKTASRRTVPIFDNCARWLAPFATESGPVCPFERPDKQCFQYLGPAAGLEWKHNGLRHSFISYRLAEIKNVHQVSRGRLSLLDLGHFVLIKIPPARDTPDERENETRILFKVMEYTHPPTSTLLGVAVRCFGMQNRRNLFCNDKPRPQRRIAHEIRTVKVIKVVVAS